MKAVNWIIAMLVFALLVACGAQTPMGEQPLPEVLPATATWTPAPAAPPEPDAQPTPTPETEPVAAAVPDASPPLTGWAAVRAPANWVLISYGDALNPTVVRPGTYATISFIAGDGQVSGLGGCNGFFTSYSADDDGNLTINSPLGATKIACDIGMEQEALFFGALETVSGYTVTERGELLLAYDSGKLTFMPETALVDTVWVLTAYGNPANLTTSKSGVATTAIFSADGTINGFTGCNNYVANYTLAGNQLTVSLGSTTLSECAIGMEQQRAFVTLLGTAQSYRLGANALEITTRDGAVLHFSDKQLPLENVRWQLLEVDGHPLPGGVSANALFTPADSPVSQDGENRVTGNAGCNTFSSTYSLTGNLLMAGPLGLTAAACETSAMQVEDAMVAGLQSVQSFEITGDQLKIDAESGSLLFYADRFPLAGPQWILTGIGPRDNPQPPVAGGPFTATFRREFGAPSGTKSGATGCRSYEATYYASYDQIKANLPQTSSGDCTDAQLEAEQGYFLSLNAARDYRILGGELYVYYNNNVLIFVGNYAAAHAGSLAPLDNTRWQLRAMGESGVIPGSEVTLSFEINADGRTGKISGSGGCNPYDAAVKNDFALGPVIYSAISCTEPEGIMTQEGLYFTALQTANRVVVDGNILEITTDSETLVYVSKGLEPLPPTPTPAPFASVIIAPSHIHPGGTVTYDGSLSTPQGGIVTYRWWFTGDVIAEGVSVQRKYQKIGAYDAILTVIDANGQQAESSIKTRVHSYLVGPVWTSADGTMTIKFNGSRISGNAGCNDYSAGYTSDEELPGKTNNLTVSSVGHGNETCGEDIMIREDRFLENLATAKSYKINVDSLTLNTGEKSYVFYLAP